MKTPKSPDYEGQARAQGQENRETAAFNAVANRPNIHSYYGSQDWSAPDTSGRQTLTETLNPSEQRKYETRTGIEQGGLDAVLASMPEIQKAITGTAWNLPGAALTGFLPGTEPRWGSQIGLDQNLVKALPQLLGDIDKSGLTALPGNADATRQRVTDAVYSQGARYLDPQFAEQQSGLETQLENMGLARGSEAWNREMARLNRDRMMAYGDLRDRSILSGGQEAERDYGMDMGRRAQTWAEALAGGEFRNQSRQQGFNELTAQNQLWNEAVLQDHNLQFARANLYNQGRQQQFQELTQGKLLPINIMASMLGLSQVNAPQFQPFNNNIQAEAAPIYQAARDQGNFNVQSANARNALVGSLISGAAGMGSSAITKYSDRRLKSNIERIGTTPGGVPIYSYLIFGRPEIGVMADEVPESARVMGEHGFWMVDYSKVQ